jgi:hypothetical protein
MKETSKGQASCQRLNSHGQAAKVAWRGTVAAGSVARLAAAARGQAASAFGALTAAAREVGAAAGAMLEASNRMPGGQLLQRALLVALLPFLIIPAVTGEVRITHTMPHHPHSRETQPLSLHAMNGWQVR